MSRRSDPPQLVITIHATGEPAIERAHQLIGTARSKTPVSVWVLLADLFRRFLTWCGW